MIAITDEGRAELDAFFAAWTGAFPAIVVSDAARRSFMDHGVSGTPTFVLIDDAGRIRSYEVGYSRKRGLHLGADR